MRLDLYLSQTHQLRKAAASALVASGVVRVDGAIVTSPSFQVILEVETVTVEGEVVRAPFHRLLMVHKPRGVVCERSKNSASWQRAHGWSFATAPVSRSQVPTCLQAPLHQTQCGRLSHFRLAQSINLGALNLGKRLSDFIQN